MNKQTNKLLQCSICIDVFSDPRTLPCLHTFCFKCIAARFADIIQEDEEELTCPECQEESVIPKNGLAGLKKNLFVASLLFIVTGPESTTTTFTG